MYVTWWRRRRRRVLGVYSVRLLRLLYSGGRRVIGGAKINNQYCLSIFFPALNRRRSRARFPYKSPPCSVRIARVHAPASPTAYFRRADQSAARTSRAAATAHASPPTPPPSAAAGPDVVAARQRISWRCGSVAGRKASDRR